MKPARERDLNRSLRTLRKLRREDLKSAVMESHSEDSSPWFPPAPANILALLLSGRDCPRSLVPFNTQNREFGLTCLDCGQAVFFLSGLPLTHPVELDPLMVRVHPCVYNSEKTNVN